MNKIFDRDESERRKEKGMAMAANNKVILLRMARGIAMQLVQKHGTVHADMVGEEMWKQHQIKTLGPAAGALFKQKHWKFTGDWYPSARKSNHGRMLRIWSLK